MEAGGLYRDIKGILKQARNSAVKAVNFCMVVAYWEIGKRIVEEEQQGEERAGYGKAILKELSKKLTAGFGEGFSVDNLVNFRRFYLVFSVKQISEAVPRKLRSEVFALQHALTSNLIQFPISCILRRELSWTNYCLFMQAEKEAARNYYMNEAADQNWSAGTLERQINSLYFERLLSSKNKSELMQHVQKEAEQDKPGILDFVKDPYEPVFLQLPPNATCYQHCCHI